MTRTQKWLIGVAGFFVLLLVALYFFDWNLARPYIARKVTAYTGRAFAINGDLNVHLSLRPRIVANRIVLGNADWSRDTNMAEIERLDFRIDLLKLLGGHWTFPEIALSEPRLILEVNKDGTPNWVFKEDDKNKTRDFPSIDALTIDHGTAIYRDPTIKTDLSLDVNTLNGSKDDPEPAVELTGKGRFKGMATSVRARGGALLSLRSADRPYAIKADATLGATKASVDGTLLDPLHLKGEELNFRLEGSDLALLYPILGVPIPPTPAYKLAGFLSHSGELWTFKRFKGTVGQSDLAGDFAVDRGKQPQLITADLVSRNLDMKDLGGFIGADRGNKPSEKPPPSDKVLPTEPFSLEKLRAADADVRFKGAKIITEKLPLEKMETHLIVKNGTLKLAPLNFGVAGGSLVTQIEMDGRKPRIVTHADITAKGLHLDQLLPKSKLTAASVGTLGGRAKLDGSGNSMAQMLGTANGDAALIMDGGSISELMMRLSNLDIANSIAVLLGGDKQIPIRCMVSNFKAVNGDFKVEALVLDTPKVNMTGSGNVNFTDESLNLRLVSQSKGFSLASLRGPIDITGSFKNPAVHPAMGNVIARGGIAALLGVVTAGIGVLIPLLEFGNDKDSNCTALIGKAKADTGVKESDLAPRSASKR
jgi:AsmA family protein